MSMAVENVVLGVIANAMTSVLAYIGRQAGILPLDEFLGVLRSRKHGLLSVIREATASVSKSPEINDRGLREFLRSSEVETIARQVVSSKIVGTAEAENLRLARNEFRSSLRLQLGGSAVSLRETSDRLFDMLVAGCDHALGLAIESGVLAAHEARSTARYEFLASELRAIQRNLELLSGTRRPDPHLIRDFERKYRQQVSNSHKSLTPPDFDKARRIPIDDLYVEPEFRFVPAHKGMAEQTVSLAQYRKRIHRTVLLGDPGGGKSAFASKLSYDLATHFSETLVGNRQVTPLHVVLRDYGAAKREAPLSILQFIAATAESDFQLTAVPYAAFEYMLLNGHSMVILDGLDELLDTSYRRAITSDIELFCEMYPSTPVLVTSRKVGYDQAPLDPTRFDVYHLSPFTEEQSGQYVHKWFELDEDLSADQKRDKATAFLVESRTAPDLRSNALMLALMCNIYRGEGYFPKNRPDVYEKCATMLFERWDKSRGIQSTLPFEAHIRPIMMHLAHWIYTDEKRQGGVTEGQLTEVSGTYLHGRRFEDLDEAHHAARAFVQFCSGRAWVFTDTGTTSAGDRLYQFTHRTFLEYFTAAYLVRTHRTPQALAKALLSKVARKEWDVVAQLAFQIQSKQFEGAGDELLNFLLGSLSSAKARSSINIVSFLGRCLGFMVPAPQVRKRITDAAVDLIIGWAKADSKSSQRASDLHLGDFPRELYEDLCGVAAENAESVASAVKKAILTRVRSGDKLEAYLALEFGLGLGFFSFGAPASGALRKLSDQIHEEAGAHISGLLPLHLPLSVLAWWREVISAGDILRWHGPEGLFSDTPVATFGVLLVSPAVRLVRQAGYREVAAEGLRSDLGAIGKSLLKRAQPWVVGPFRRGYVRFMFDKPSGGSEERTETELLDLGHASLFGLFTLIAVILELTEHDDEMEPKRMLREMRASTLPAFSLLADTFSARYLNVPADLMRAEMKHCGLTAPEASLVEGWARHDVDLVDASAVKRPRKRPSRAVARKQRKVRKATP